MSKTKAVRLSEQQLDAFGAELDALHTRTMADVGKVDADYIRKVVRWVRYTGFGGRALLMVGAIGGAFVPWLLWPACIVGVLLLALSKIMENMEVGHNVIHGQYDFMNDPQFDSRTYEWDIVATSDNWRHSHNYRHHTYTNVRGMDDDIGYGLLRVFPEQRWKPYHLFQPLIVPVFALLFQWGVAIQELKVGRLFGGKGARAKIRREFKPVRRKMGRQLLKDYVLFPALAGPFFLPVLLGNLVANGIRNVWTFVVIFCGHFTADMETFPKQVLRNESRGHWYLRQLRGSSNIGGGPVMNLLTGNLSHQIEHHFYPDVPAHRYREMSKEVREICKRYGQPYDVGSLPRQFGEVLWRITRHAFPSRPKRASSPQGMPQSA